MLAKARQRWWQMLPLGPCGEENSPYRCYSAFAGNPLLISPELLFEDGLLSQSELRSAALPPGNVNYVEVGKRKMGLLRLAFDHFCTAGSVEIEEAFEKFSADEKNWLDDFSLFISLYNHNPGQSWTEWPKPLVRRNPAALTEATNRFADDIQFHKFVQFIFARQLLSLRLHAAKAGVRLIGDLPIFVSPDSSDVWTNPKLFQLDRNLQPSAVSGVPPDLFCSTGQRWGNPLYNWKEMAKDNFAFWRARLNSALCQADLVRIDHFRGFEAYWRIPGGETTGENGQWIKAPGKELFEALRTDHPRFPLLAEDLGIITPAVEALRDEFGLPGMRVLQFGFSGDPGDPHTPHNFIRHCFAYTGTHDNDTTVGWYRSLSTSARRKLIKYAPELDWPREPSWSMIRLLHASSAGQAIIPMQDLLSLDNAARMNTPGRGEDNWAWRFTSFADCIRPLSRLADMTETYERHHAH